jgi:hypothetical protein
VDCLFWDRTLKPGWIGWNCQPRKPWPNRVEDFGRWLPGLESLAIQKGGYVPCIRRNRSQTDTVRRHLQPHTGVHENNYFVVCIVIFLSFASVVFFCPVICPCHFSVIFLSFFCCFLFWSCPLSLSFFCHFFVIFLSFSYHFLQFLMIFFNCSNFF